MISRIISSQSPNVDAVSGATYSSNGIITAVQNALSQAIPSGNQAVVTPTPTPSPKPTKDVYKRQEKYFIEDGVRYHHILNPATGYPARSGLTSVTVVCDDGLNADGLSTACFVLGKEKAEELLKKYNADGLFVDDSDHVWMTEGMKERFQLLKDTYSIGE